MRQMPLLFEDIPDKPMQIDTPDCESIRDSFKKGYGKLKSDKKELLKATNFDIETGWSDYYELPKDYRDSRCGNGDGWLRFDNGSILGAYLVIRIAYENGVHLINDPIRGKIFEEGGLPTEKRNSGGRIAIRFEGYVSNVALKPPISNLGKTKAQMIEAGMPYQCAMIGAERNLEVDHRQGRPFLQPDGKIGWEPINNPNNLQFLTRQSNLMKCRMCTECRTTNIRPSGRKFNYSLEYLEGSADFEVMGPGCRGCVLYNPKAFQERVDALLQAASA